MKDPLNCPFCQAEVNGYSEGWAYTPEAWEEVRRIHLERHCEKCPTCGQPIIKRKNDILLNIDADIGSTDNLDITFANPLFTLTNNNASIRRSKTERLSSVS